MRFVLMGWSGGAADMSVRDREGSMAGMKAELTWIL